MTLNESLLDALNRPCTRRSAKTRFVGVICQRDGAAGGQLTRIETQSEEGGQSWRPTGIVPATAPGENEQAVAVLLDGEASNFYVVRPSVAGSNGQIQ